MNTKNNKNTVHGFDLIELIENNHSNSLKSINHLKQDGYWSHFTTVNDFYNQITSEHVKLTNPLDNILFHYLFNSSINLMKGVANIVGGHFTDSGIYLRRSIESIRHSIFLRENPEQVEYWHKQNEHGKFNKCYSDWIRKNGNGIVHNEFPYHKDHFDHASSFSAHPGPKLFSAQHEVENNGNSFNLTLNYSELTPNKEGYIKLLAAYFWTIQIHSSCLNWWIKYSRIIPTLSGDEEVKFQEFKRELNIDHIRIREAVKSTLSDGGR